MSKLRYNVKTWEPWLERFTRQQGLSVPSENISLWGVRRVLRELREVGYEASSVRDDSGRRVGDPSVLVELVDA